MLLLFAAEGLEALAGGSGWVGAGLLGMVLAWLLLFHLPAKDKQMERMIADKDKVVSDLMTRHEAIQEKSRVAYQATLDVVVNHCDKEVESIKYIAEKMAAAIGART